MLENLDRFLPPLDRLQKRDAVDFDAVNSAAGLESLLAQRWGVDPKRVCVGTDILSGVMAGLASPDDRVLLAAPTWTDVLDAIPASGCRYIDVGRNHRFEVDAQGWSTALQWPTTTVAYVAHPDVPTSTTVDSALLNMVTTNERTLVLDVRGRMDCCGASTSPTLGSHVVEIGRVGGGIGGVDQPLCYVVGPMDRMEGIRDRLESQERSMGSLSDALYGLMHDDAVNRRLAQWRTWIHETAEVVGTVPTSVVHAIHGPLVWVRVPGVASAEIAASVNHESVLGRDCWTWRDSVAVLATPPGESRGRLVDAFQAAL